MGPISFPGRGFTEARAAGAFLPGFAIHPQPLRSSLLPQGTSSSLQSMPSTAQFSVPETPSPFNRALSAEQLSPPASVQNSLQNFHITTPEAERGMQPSPVRVLDLTSPAKTEIDPESGKHWDSKNEENLKQLTVTPTPNNGSQQNAAPEAPQNKHKEMQTPPEQAPQGQNGGQPEASKTDQPQETPAKSASHGQKEGQPEAPKTDQPQETPAKSASHGQDGGQTETTKAKPIEEDAKNKVAIKQGESKSGDKNVDPIPSQVAIPTAPQAAAARDAPAAKPNKKEMYEDGSYWRTVM